MGLSSRRREACGSLIILWLTRSNTEYLLRAQVPVMNRDVRFGVGLPWASSLVKVKEVARRAGAGHGRDPGMLSGSPQHMADRLRE